MDHNYQHLELQVLIDLLAEETQQFTKAFISGKPNNSAQHKAVIDALIAEIKRRKKEELLPPDIGLHFPSNDLPANSFNPQ